MASGTPFTYSSNSVETASSAPGNQGLGDVYEVHRRAKEDGIYSAQMSREPSSYTIQSHSNTCIHQCPDEPFLDYKHMSP